MNQPPASEDARSTAPDLPADTDSAVAVQRSRLRFPVVGIGASAGGLAALTRFFEASPRDSGMAYVVILHLSPNYKSHAAEILQRAAPLPVEQVTETVAIHANRVYVIPPSHQLAMTDGQLVLTADTRGGGRPTAIDNFFRTLAHAHGEYAVGIVMSGSGADGAVGIARIKEQGGVTFVQSPDDAEHADMPRAAIATGEVDFVLAAAEMPERLATLRRTQEQMRLPADIADSLRASPPRDGDDAGRDEDALRDVMQLLRSRTQHDFRSYKRATVLRRLERRMQVTSTTSLQGYRDYLRDQPQETQALLQDMLISVTNFFRDRRAFEALERDALPDLVARVPPDHAFRAWVPGCATGEEAYSVAMLVHEALQGRADSRGFQVFASDIDARALAKARAGVYPAAAAGDMTPARLRQFMQGEHNQYRVVRSLRERVMFAQHNLLRDPPFSRLDLIACRNLLIYLDRDAQAAVLQTFRFALNPRGVLFLGSAESVEVVSDLFEPIDKQHRLYRPNANAHWHRSPAQLQAPVTSRAQVAELPPPATDRALPPFAKWHERALRSLVPASVLLDADHDILHVSEDASAYLQPQVGVPSRSLVNNVQPALRLELRAALFKSSLSGEPVEASALRPLDDGTQAVVQLVVRPYVDPDARVPTVLVTFEETDYAGPAAPVAQGGDGSAAVVGELEAEVARLRERLRETLEQAETSTEELKASNEELQALNEELRSATEELETSKEELQSVNEELVTVNDELTGKVEEAGRINDDLQNLIASTDIATVFVDGALRIKRYTPRAGELFSLIAGDVGRPLPDITHRLDYDELTGDANAAFQNLRPVEREVRGVDGRVLWDPLESTCRHASLSIL